MAALMVGPVTGPSVRPIGRSVTTGVQRRPSYSSRAAVRQRTGKPSLSPVDVTSCNSSGGSSARRAVVSSIGSSSAALS